jgi:hypothetical protein
MLCPSNFRRFVPQADIPIGRPWLHFALSKGAFVHSSLTCAGGAHFTAPLQRTGKNGEDDQMHGALKHYDPSGAQCDYAEEQGERFMALHDQPSDIPAWYLLSRARQPSSGPFTEARNGLDDNVA